MCAEKSSFPPERPLESQYRALVIGASSGIGAELVSLLVKEGYLVAAVARREPELASLRQSVNEAAGADRCRTYTHDVTDFDAIPELFQRITRDLDGLDLAIYVAGIEPQIESDEYDFNVDRTIVQTNLLGAMAWLNQVALRFQRTGAGHIVGISSMAGERGRVGFPAYSSSKAGLTTYLEALRNRLTRQGVAVTTIKPGMVQTRLLDHVDKTMWPIPASAAAEQIYRAIRSRRQTVYVPFRWRLVSLVIVHLPSFIFRRLKI